MYGVKYISNTYYYILSQNKDMPKGKPLSYFGDLVVDANTEIMLNKQNEK